MGRLLALQAGSRHVRLVRIPPCSEYNDLQIVTEAAADLISVWMDERVQRLRQFLDERGLATPPLPSRIPPCPLRIEQSIPFVDHVDWVSRLPDTDVQLGSSWLRAIVERYATQ